MKERLKAAFVTLTVIFIVVLFSNIAMAEDTINIYSNNQKIEFNDAKPVKINGEVFVPARIVAKALNCDVIWSSALQNVSISSYTTKLSFEMNNIMAVKAKLSGSGTPIVIECPNYPRVINNEPYVPVRKLAEALDYTVGWDGSKNAVIIMHSESISYAGSKAFSTFAGNGVKQRHDSTIDKMQFLSPSSIDIASDGTMYISDDGVIRKIKDGKSETIEFEQSYISSNVARCYGNDIYFLTNAFEDKDNMKYYGIVKLSGKSADGVFITEAVASRINDFQIDSKGNIYIIYKNIGVGKTYLGKLNISTGNVDYIQEIDDGFGCMAIDNNDNVYLGNSVKGSIYYYNVAENKLTLCAGVDGQTKFVDGNIGETFFYEPRAMEYSNGYLYIVDYNLVRRMTVNNGAALNTETLAGKLTAETDPQTVVGSAKEAAIAPSYLMDIAVVGERVYITDPKNAVIRAID